MYQLSSATFPDRPLTAKSVRQDSCSQKNPDSGVIQLPIAQVKGLSEKEQSDRLHLERQVETAFYQAGKALMELRSRKLYRDTHKTFEDYCKDRFGFGRRHPYRLIEATRVVDNLTKMCPIWTHSEVKSLTPATAPDTIQILPTNESQVRPLLCLEPEEQRTAWELSVEAAGGKVPSARLVKTIVDKMQQGTKLPNPYKIGEVCQIIGKSHPKLQSKTGCWGIITSTSKDDCTITTWDGECAVGIESLASLEYSETECKYMQQLCQRLRKLHLVADLDPSVNWWLSFLGKQAQPYLTPVQDKLLVVTEREYGLLSD